MSIVDSVKRAPRWAWLTAAGVGLGAGAIKLWRDRDAEGSELVAGEVVGAPSAIGTAASPIAGAPGIVVPPVIIGGGGEGTPAGLPDLFGIVGDVFSGYTSLMGLVVGGNQQLLGQSMGTIESIATAGNPPGQAVQNPSPIVINVPMPQASPAALPAAPPKGSQPTPCCNYHGHPLSYWRNAGINRKGSRWRWPDGGGFDHTRAFEGNAPCDGGGSAPHGGRREC